VVPLGFRRTVLNPISVRLFFLPTPHVDVNFLLDTLADWNETKRVRMSQTHIQRELQIILLWGKGPAAFVLLPAFCVRTKLRVGGGYAERNSLRRP